MLINISDSDISKLLDQASVDKIEKLVSGAVIINSDSEVLLLQRDKKDYMGGLVELPSGAVHENETIIDGLVREVKEETSLDVTVINSYIGSFDYLSSSGKKTRQLSFLISTHNGKVKLNKDEHSIYYWIKESHKLYNSLNISVETKKIIHLTNELLLHGSNNYDI